MNGLSSVQTSPVFEPTAVLFVPYRAFYAFSTFTSGIHCDAPAMACWHPSLNKIPVFGYAYNSRKKIAAGTCPVDVLQAAVIQAWDDLRLRHRHIAVYGDVETLHDQMTSVVAGASERVLVRFPCLMDDSNWHFYNGSTDRNTFLSITHKFPFEEYIANQVC